MTFFTDTVDRLRPLVEADPGYCTARAAFKAAPSAETFEAVCEWVAFHASPGEERELGGRFDDSWSSVTVCDLMYRALTESLLGMTGYLYQHRMQDDDRRRDWSLSRAVLQRAGVTAH